MNKQTFLSVLAKKLAEAGMEEGHINHYTRRFTAFFNTISDEELDSEFKNESDIEAVVNTILEKHGIKTTPSDNTDDLIIDTPTPNIQSDSSESSDAMADTSVTEPKSKFDSIPTEAKADNTEADNAVTFPPVIAVNDLAVPDFDEKAFDEIFSSGNGETQVFSTPSQVKNSDDNESNGSVEFTKTDIDIISSNKDSLKKNRKIEKIPASPLFCVLAIITTPITIPLFIFVCAVFGIMYLTVAAVIASLVALMAVIAAVGAALALTGIIYGVIQLFKVVPIGLFELGIGLTIGGAAMLLAVLLYNLAVNVTPHLFRYITVFLKFVFEKIGELIHMAKRECSKK